MVLFRYSTKTFSNKFISINNDPKAQNSSAIKQDLGKPPLNPSLNKLDHRHNNDKGERLSSINEDFDFDDFDEKSPGNDDNPKSMGKRSFVCKTLTTVKSRSTFVDTTSPHRGSGHANYSYLIQGSDSLLKPSSHKGSSDIFPGLNYPSSPGESKLNQKS